MREARRAWPTAVLAMLAAAAVCLPVAAQPPARGAVLVTTEWLTLHLDDPQLRIVDLGKTRAQFEAAHIPNAQYVDWRVDLVDPAGRQYFQIAPRTQIEALLSRLGVEPSMTVVLYDSQSSRVAARMFWILRQYGHRGLRILDGGAAAWAAAGGPEGTGTAGVAATAYRFEPSSHDYLADKAFVAAALAQPGTALVDARAPEFYSGASAGSQFGRETPNAKTGHIAGAVNFFWADHYNDDGTFKPASEFEARYGALGVMPTDFVVSYCHVGLQAATPWFVLTQLLGYPNVRLYDRSMAEWANATGTLLVTEAE